MAFRITNIQTTNTFISQILDNRKALENKREEISSGYAVYNPSDDPGRAGTIDMLQRTMQRLDRHQDRIGFATGLLETQENTLDSANNVMMRVRELATQAANGSIASDVRAQMADEVFQLRDSLASLANTKYQGSYIYGGLVDDTEPFSLDTTFYTAPAGVEPTQTHWDYGDLTLPANYGKDQTRDVNISDTDSVRVITRGDDVFEDALNAIEMLGRAMKGYRTTLNASGDPTGAGTAFNLPSEYDQQTAAILTALDSVESARVNDIEVELSSVGARMNRLEQTNEMIDSLKLSTEKSRANLQDTDIFQAASELSNLQIALEGLMASGSRINSLSLLNYI